MYAASRSSAIRAGTSRTGISTTARSRGRGRARVNGRPLLFFHFSGFAPGTKLLSKHQDRFALADLPAPVRALADDYAADLMRNGIEECRQLPYAFGVFRSGEPIPDLVRRCYREDFPWDDPHPDLWTAAGQAFVVDWLNRPAPAYGRAPWLTRLAATFYRLRPDIQAAFPDVGGKHGRSYAHWFVEHRRRRSGSPQCSSRRCRPRSKGGAARVRQRRKTRRGTLRRRRWHRRAATTMAFPVVVPEAALDRDPRSSLRGAYQVAYRVAWGIRRAVKPLTTQAFRHRVRHALLRKAYFDDSHETPPLVTAAGRAVAAAGRRRRNIRRPVRRTAGAAGGDRTASTWSATSPRKAASASRRARCCAS